MARKSARAVLWYRLIVMSETKETTMKNMALFLLLSLCLTTSYAVEVAGVELQEKIVMPGVDAPLELNGAGIRKKFFFKIYLASLYLMQKQADPMRIVETDQARRIQMDMLYSKVDKEKFIEGWNEGFAANTSAEELASLRQRLNAFNAMFETLVEGDRVVMDYLPGEGTRVIIKGEEKGVIPGLDFNQALLKVWLGDSPVTGSLKQDLLGL
jgi:hypothetical protein